MDNIEIHRTTVMGASGPTFGEIFVNGMPVGVTLEPEFMSGKLMSAGAYSAFKRVSTKSGRMVIELRNTSPRTNIQIHIGNSVRHTEGCILVGSHRSGNEIAGSARTMNDILARVQGPLQVNIR